MTYSFVQYAELKTTYKWISSQNDIFKGKCFEVDSSSNGKSFSRKVKTYHCRPPETTYLFLFKQKSCFEVDTKTRGMKYLDKVKLSFCRTKNIEKYLGTIQSSFGCYEIDSPSKGQNYYQKIKNDHCQKLDSSQFVFMLTKPPLGKCFNKAIDGNLSPVKLKFCRPKTVSYKFIRESQFQGSCIEHDPKGIKYYSKKVKNDFCKTTDTTFVFIKNKKGLGGKCYEVDRSSMGKDYTNKVKLNECKQVD